MLSIGVLVVDSMVDLSIHQTGVIYVSTQVFTTSGHGAMLANTPFHGMLVIGIAVAMHGVATYAHIYMGYEQYACSPRTPHGVLGPLDLSVSRHSPSLWDD